MAAPKEQTLVLDRLHHDASEKEKDVHRCVCEKKG